MSLFKRKSSSLDPIQKQKKFKQTQYYLLLDKCSQIPNDDKMIIRKNINEYQQYLISLLQKYRKEENKNLKELQIFLRKYIQQYKIDHPKYPTLKLAKQLESLSKPKKIDSMCISVAVSNVSSKISENNIKSSTQKLKLSKIPFNNSLIYYNPQKQQQRNYQKIIQSRKNQRYQKTTSSRDSLNLLNISNTRSSIRINKQNQSLIFSKNEQKQSIQSCRPNKIQKQEILVIDVNISNIDLLQTMRFRMKRDQIQDEYQQNNLNNQNNQTLNVNNIFKKDEISKIQQPRKSIECLKEINDNQIYQRQQNVKRKLFQSDFKSQKSNTNECKVDQRESIKSKNEKNQRISIDSQSSNKNLSSAMKLDLKTIQRRKSIYEYNSSIQKDQKINKSRHHDFIQQQKQNTIQNISLIDQIHSVRKNAQNLFFGTNISQASSVRKLFNGQQNSMNLFYLNSQRKKSNLLSHRLTETNTYMNQLNQSISKQSSRVNKDSSRMLFSHRMQQVISGRKQQKNKQNQVQNDLHSVRFDKIVSQSEYSMKKQQKSVQKLSFWNRIQDTINT